MSRMLTVSASLLSVCTSIDSSNPVWGDSAGPDLAAEEPHGVGVGQGVGSGAGVHHAHPPAETERRLGGARHSR